MDVERLLSEMTLEEKAGMCSGLDFWHLKGVERLGIPSVMVTDGPHGLRKQVGETDMMGINESIRAVCFPTASALAASFDRELLKTVGETIGDECRAEQVSVILGPGMNGKRHPNCGRNFEYFTEDPWLSSELGKAFIRGVQSRNVGTSVKHFACNNQEHERMNSNSVVDERSLREIYLASFEGAIREAKPATVMCSYNAVNGKFAAENEQLLTGILRDEWGYEGVVITDWGAIKERVSCLKAGLDIEMPGGNPAPDAAIVAAVQNGELKEKVLDESVRRILKLIDFCTADDGKEYRFDYERDHAIAGKAAEECAVLLKNEQAALPLSKSEKVLFVGEFAARPRYQGSGSSHINSWKTTSVLEAAEAAGHSVPFVQGYTENPSEKDEVLLQEAVSAAKGMDAVVVFAGLPSSMESEGVDRRHMCMPENQNRLIAALCEVSAHVIVVLHNGSPVEMPWADRVSAILEMYLGGENVGTAEYRLLYGEANPSGKLAESFPLKLQHNPAYLNYPGYNHTVEYREGVFVGYRYYDTKDMVVRFPFGHGLSYTSFAYSDLKLDKTCMSDEEELTVSVTVTNTGSRSGNSRWYSGSGIYRPVWLYVGPRESIRPESVKLSTVSIEPAVVRVQSPISVKAELAGVYGEGTDFTLTIPDAKLWSAETPDLYTAKITSSEDETEVTFGIRQITWSNKGLFINGKETLLRGGCIHHDSGILGAATYAESEERRVRILKENGFNAIRSSHNPASSALLDACDRLGMYVMDETFDMWYNRKTPYDYGCDWAENWEADTAAMVERDFNHPSVILYSIGNEVAEPVDPKGVDAGKAQIDLCHRLDPSRPVTCGTNLMILSRAAKGQGIYQDGEQNTGAEGKKQTEDPSKVKNASLMFNIPCLSLSRTTTVRTPRSAAALRPG